MTIQELNPAPKVGEDVFINYEKILKDEKPRFFLLGTVERLNDDGSADIIARETVRAVWDGEDSWIVVKRY